MTDAEKKKLFLELKKLIQQFAHGELMMRTTVVGSQAKEKKRQIHLYGKKKVAIGRLPERQTYVFGVIEQKHFVGFYSMPMYSHERELPLKNVTLKKARKGKSCLNLVSLNASMRKELEVHMKKGIALYRKEGWI